MTDPAFISATEAARQVAAGECSVRELVETALARVGSVNPLINAVIAVSAQQALAEADELDAGAEHGGLRGIPITVKDALNVAGLATTWGNPDWRDARADSDAAVVARLRTAGAVVTGKTNVAMMLGDFGQSSNPLFGTTNNPYNLDHAAGGSSGGAAAAVASGMSFLDYGSDVVGSIRIPAAFCGVYGLKPTAGIVPLAGLQPPGPAAPPTKLDDMASVGPIARTAADLRTALECTAGPNNPVGTGNMWSLPAPRADRLHRFRVGVILDHPAAAVTGPVGDAVSDVIDTLAGLSVSIREGWPDGVDWSSSCDCFDYLVGAYFVLKTGHTGAGPNLNRLPAAEAEQRRLKAAWDRYFRDIDVLLCPVTVSTAPHHDFRPMVERTIDGDQGPRPYSDLAAWVPHASVAGLPALSAPIGMSSVDNLPIGLQIIGPRNGDDTVLTFAERLADHVGAYCTPPISYGIPAPRDSAHRQPPSGVSGDAPLVAH